MATKRTSGVPTVHNGAPGEMRGLDTAEKLAFTARRDAIRPLASALTIGITVLVMLPTMILVPGKQLWFAGAILLALFLLAWAVSMRNRRFRLVLLPPDVYGPLCALGCLTLSIPILVRGEGISAWVVIAGSVVIGAALGLFTYYWLSRQVQDWASRQTASTRATPQMSEVIDSPQRLQIMAVLCALECEVDSGYLSERLGLSDSALNDDLEILSNAGYARSTFTSSMQQQRTWIAATNEGRSAYLRQIEALRQS